MKKYIAALIVLMMIFSGSAMAEDLLNGVALIDGKNISQKSKKNYKKWVKYFCKYIKEEGYTANEVRANPQEYIQRYADKLIAEGKSASTIHSYISPLCVVFQIKMNKIIKPERKTAANVRGRGGKNEQGAKEKIDIKNKRLVEFQKVVGIRRSELAKLKGDNLKYDESGYLCVEVEKGKGGKRQLQRIDASDEEFVSGYFNGTSEKVFSKSEMNNKIDLHRLRAEHAAEMYAKYMRRIMDPKEKMKLQNEIILRFKNHNKAYNNPNAPKKYKDKLLRDFIANMYGDYWVRGNNKRLAIKKGLPLKYDKLAVMAVSVFHLSHWRNSVAVENYLLAVNKISV